MIRFSRIRRDLKQEGLPGLMAKGLRLIANRIEDGRSSHQSSAYRALSRYMEFSGMRILEVGGHQSCESAHPFVDEGADVVVSGLDHITEEISSQGSNPAIVRADALSLSDKFEGCSFDVVYGLSVIEHIPSPEVFLREVDAILKPGGLAYFEGRPLWSGPYGHHVWVSTWNGKYKGIASANYLFSDLPGVESVNPLPNWAQLMMTESQMAAYLAGKSIPGGDVECIVDSVFHSRRINRLSMTEIASAYGASKLRVLEANVSRLPVPKEVERLLRSRCGHGVDYGITGVSYVLAKT